MEIAMPFKLLIALAIGAAIGLEREVHEKHDDSPESPKITFIGVRSFALITLLGCIAGLLHSEYLSLFYTLNITFMIFTIVHYILNCIQTKDLGITTELAVIFSYLIGALIALEALPIQITLAITVVLVLILAYKEKIKGFTEDINKNEIRAFVAYALIALVVLPFLPNKSITFNDVPVLKELLTLFNFSVDRLGDIELINPFKLWMIVAIITGVDVAGYVLERTVGQQKGWFMTSFIGGIVSSTATTISLAQQSKETRATNQVVAAAILATFASFFSTFLIVMPVNSEFVVRAIPTFLFLILASLLSIIFFMVIKDKAGKEVHSTQPKEHTIFALGPALKFAGIFLIVRFVTKISLEFFGNSGFLISSAIAGVTGIDAATINTAELAGKAISFDTAVLAFIIINAVNLVAKSFYSFIQGKKEFAIKYAVSMVFIILVSFLGLMFV